MKAFLLAAGFGKRLRPLTEDMAKPVIPLVNTPVLEHILSYLWKNGITEVVVNLHYLPESIKEAVKRIREPGIKVSYSYEPEILGAAGGLKKAEVLLGDGTFIMMNTDLLIDLDLKEAVSFHQSRGALATMVLAPAKDEGFTSLGLDKEGRIIESNEAGMNFVGLHIFEGKIYEYIPEGRYCEIYPTIYKRLLGEGKGVYGYRFTGYWQHLGTFEGYLTAHRDILRRRIDIPIRCEEVKKGLWIGEGTMIPLSAEMTPPVVIGENVTIGAYSTIGPYVVIGEGVSIGRGSRIMNSLLLEGAKIKEGATLAGCVIGRDWIKRV